MTGLVIVLEVKELPDDLLVAGVPLQVDQGVVEELVDDGPGQGIHALPAVGGQSQAFQRLPYLLLADSPSPGFLGLLLALLQADPGDGLEVINVVEAHPGYLLDLGVNVPGYGDVNEEEGPSLPGRHGLLDLGRLQDEARGPGAADDYIYLGQGPGELCPGG